MTCMKTKIVNSRNCVSIPQVWLENLSTCQDTLLNGTAVTGLKAVSHLDVFTISDRSFRFEFPTPKKTTPKKSPKVSH